MAEEEQVKPLAASPYRIRSDEEETKPLQLIDLQNRRYLLCFGCITAILLIIVTIILVLSFTVWHINDPVIRINEFTIQGFDVNGTATPPELNITLSAKITVKNSNAGAFKFNDVTTSVFYGGVLVGEAKTPPGKVKARRTVRMNVAVDIDEQKMAAVTSFSRSNVLNLTSSTRIAGNVKALNRNKFVEATMNCSMTYNVTSHATQEEKCKRV